MSPMLSVLNEMRGRLGMFLGTTSLTKLAAFLRGYEHALDKYHVCPRDPLLAEFRDWVQRRFHTEKHSWEDLILMQSANETEAVETFWELFDQFQRETQDRTASPPSSLDTFSKPNPVSGSAAAR